MRTLYVHGFGSRFDPENPKLKALSELGEVVGVDVDYCEGFKHVLTTLADTQPLPKKRSLAIRIFRWWEGAD